MCNINFQNFNISMHYNIKKRNFALAFQYFHTHQALLCVSSILNCSLFKLPRINNNSIIITKKMDQTLNENARYGIKWKTLKAIKGIFALNLNLWNLKFNRKKKRYLKHCPFHFHKAHFNNKTILRWIKYLQKRLYFINALIIQHSRSNYKKMNRVKRYRSLVCFINHFALQCDRDSCKKPQRKKYSRTPTDQNTASNQQTRSANTMYNVPAYNPTCNALMLTS